MIQTNENIKMEDRFDNAALQKQKFWNTQMMSMIIFYVFVAA